MICVDNYLNAAIEILINDINYFIMYQKHINKKELANQITIKIIK